MHISMIMNTDLGEVFLKVLPGYLADTIAQLLQEQPFNIIH